MHGRVADATGNARGEHDAVDTSSPDRDTWLLVKRGVHRTLESRDGPPERAGVGGAPGNFAGRWLWAWGTCTRKRAGQLLGVSSWKKAVVCAKQLSWRQSSSLYVVELCDVESASWRWPPRLLAVNSNSLAADSSSQ
jgi:hypothetical protein